MLKHYSTPVKTVLGDMYVDTENKDNADDEKIVSQELDTIKAQNRSLKTLLDEMSQNQNKLESTNKEYMQRIQELIQENARYKMEKTELQQQLQQEQQKCVMNEKKYNEQSLILQQQQEEYKEMHMKLDEARKELNEMRKRIRMDVSRYLEWTSDELVDWIMTLDGGDRYQIYEVQLRSSFNSEGVDGQGLGDISTIELKSWGINSFKDRNNIHKHIQNVIKGGVNNNDNDNDNNGNVAPVNMYNIEGNDGTAYVG